MQARYAAYDPLNSALLQGKLFIVKTTVTKLSLLVQEMGYLMYNCFLVDSA